DKQFAECGGVSSGFGFGGADQGAAGARRATDFGRAEFDDGIGKGCKLPRGRAVSVSGAASERRERIRGHHDSIQGLWNSAELYADGYAGGADSPEGGSGSEFAGLHECVANSGIFDSGAGSEPSGIGNGFARWAELRDCGAAR